ncbi:MAG: ABC transporter substrate-binding protein [Planctomycetes bacterium]|nr:ABC transporter substrate-binding protein [Planctomycetota bacterium]
MRDRHIFWDAAPLLLLVSLAILLGLLVVQNERGWAQMQRIREENAELAKQNQAILSRLSGSVAIQSAPAVVGPQTGSQSPGVRESTAPESGEASLSPKASGTAAETRPPKVPAIPNPALNDPHIPNQAQPRELLQFTRGDEDADDGDWLVTSIMGEPNSLNALIDNDATASDLFGQVHDGLAALCFDDLSIYEPRLARAWTKEMVCLAYAKDGKAADLAQAIDRAWEDKAKRSMHVLSIGTEAAGADQVVRIVVGEADGTYRERLQKDFGDRISMQWWFYVDIASEYFEDGQREASAKNIWTFLQENLKDLPGFEGRFLEPWLRETSVVVKMLGSEKDKDAVRQRMKDLVASPKNKGKVTDTKVAEGKREEALIAHDIVEDYLAQEKPVFTFYLNQDARWHDGTSVTARDAVFTFKMIKNPKVMAGPSRNYWQDCESCELVNDDPYVLRFTWSKPYFSAFEVTAGFSPIAEHYYPSDPKQFNEGPQNQSLMGNGAYRFEKWERGKEIVFVRNENYYGRKPHFKKVVYKVVKDKAAELLMLESGDIDINERLEAPQVIAKRGDPEFLKKNALDTVSVANVYRYIGWNARNPLFKDRPVRQALTMLIDRQRICDVILKGLAKVQNGPFHPDAPVFWKGLGETAKRFDFNPVKARKLLADAGWRDSDGDSILDKDGVKFEFTLLIVAGVQTYESIANQVKNDLAQAGILVNISPYEWSVLLQKLEQLKFDACLMGWRLGIINDPYQLWHSSQTDIKESNHCNFQVPEADRLIEASRRELNPEKRNEMMVRFQQIILEEQPYTFLFVPTRLVGYSKRIRNVKFKLIGSASDRWWVPAADQKYK